MQIAKLKAEQAVVQDQMTKDRATVERLEMLLDQARQESITAQTANQELQNEMSRLRQKCLNFKLNYLQNQQNFDNIKLKLLSILNKLVNFVDKLQMKDLIAREKKKKIVGL